MLASQLPRASHRGSGCGLGTPRSVRGAHDCWPPSSPALHTGASAAGSARLSLTSLTSVWVQPRGRTIFLFASGEFARPARKTNFNDCVTTFKTHDFGGMTSKMRDHGHNAQKLAICVRDKENTGTAVKEHAKEHCRHAKPAVAHRRRRARRRRVQRARRDGARGGGVELLAALHTTGQSAGSHGSWSGFTGTEGEGRRPCGRAQVATEVGGGAGEAWRSGRARACILLFDDA